MEGHQWVDKAMWGKRDMTTAIYFGKICDGKNSSFRQIPLPRNNITATDEIERF